MALRFSDGVRYTGCSHVDWDVEASSETKRPDCVSFSNIIRHLVDDFKQAQASESAEGSG